jgi:hypothetical protein
MSNRKCNNKHRSCFNLLIIVIIFSGMDAAERRRQQIQESKFLGGDMEHTHLVKGLDYALLQKVSTTHNTTYLHSTLMSIATCKHKCLCLNVNFIPDYSL